MGIHFKNVTIIGVGLIGGSLARVLKEKGLADEIIGIGRSEENLQKAKKLGFIDKYFNKPDSIKDSDLVFLCSHVGSFIQVIKEISPYLREKTIVTDVGSVKGALVREIEGTLPEGIKFVGGHPIAGREKAGIDMASGDLFKGANCILTPTERTDKGALEAVKAIWEEAGCDVILMDPTLHDKVYAAVSHLPHVLAYALVNTVAKMDFEGADPFSLSGSSFRDLTRIASSSPEMWKDISLYNRENIIDAIRSFEDVLRTIKVHLEEGNNEGILREFEEARRVKDEYGKNRAC